MKPDEVIIMPEETREAIEIALREMYMRVGRMIEKHRLLPPISMSVTDGDGKVIAVWDWDEKNGLECRPSEFRLPDAAGFFCVIEDCQGKKVVIKVQIEGQNTVN
jgi:hypothetical protein